MTELFRPARWLKIANVLLILSFLCTAAIQTSPVFAQDGTTPEPTVAPVVTEEPSPTTPVTPELTATPTEPADVSTPEPEGLDTTPPVASFVSPQAGATLTSSEIDLAIAASNSESGVISVDLYYSLTYPSLDLQPIASLASAPYEYVWDASLLSDATIYLTAIVQDGAGNKTTLSAIAIVLTSEQPTTDEISVQSVAPGVPVAFYPTRNALMEPTLTVAWTEPAPAADHFEILVATDSAFTSIVESNTTVTAKSYAPAGLLSNTTYYWKVRGVSSDGTFSNWSAYSYFRTKLAAPTGLTQLVETTRPTLSWDAVPSATGYMITLDLSAGFASVPVTYTTSATSFKIPTDLKLNKTYYWRVKALGNNTSNWSATTSFVSANPPTVPVLVSPLTNTLLSGDYLSISWKASTNFPVSYTAQYATDAAFTDIVVSRDGIGTLNYTFGDHTLDRNMNYYWRVRAVNAAGQYSQWSAVRTVRTTMPAPVLTSPTHESHEFVLKPTFTWEAVSGATSYSLQVALNNTFSSGLSECKLNDHLIYTEV